ncbi:hypothetical protein QR680_009144 [Steinernema hermaphroditum]|uniref:26S proteasome non-ATPase regulatory subunit 13 n=1 Tax=Steinernema hermaphroditum TaxID=289476 RepID=A0AA39IKL5_9BILA|nr:hypothetical protein QR680_009144 [Steinernema hermaphroditum]
MSGRTFSYLKKQLNNARSDKLRDEWVEMETLYTKKLWQQLSEKVLHFIENNSTNFKDMYDEFISSFENSIDRVILAKICVAVAHDMIRTSNRAAATDFLKSRDKVCSKSNVALVRLHTGQVELMMTERKVTDELAHPKAVRLVLEATQKELDGLTGVTPAHGPFYKVSAEYARCVGDYESYYREALRYLGCIDIETLPNGEQVSRATTLVTAVLLADNIFNFGELLAHPVMKFAPTFLANVISTFNAGNATDYKNLKAELLNDETFKNHENSLNEKFRMMALMEIAACRPPKERVIPFVQIVNAVDIPKNYVEMYVIKCLSKGLIRGSINQVKEEFNVDWVQPRVLDNEQIKGMRKRIENWQETVSDMSKIVHDNAKEILVNKIA